MQEIADECPQFESTVHSIFIKADLVPQLMKFLDQRFEEQCSQILLTSNVDVTATTTSRNVSWGIICYLIILNREIFQMFCRLFKALSLPCYFAIWVHFRKQYLTRYICICVYVYRSYETMFQTLRYDHGVKKTGVCKIASNAVHICVLILCIISYKTGPCSTLSADAEPVCKHTETIFSAQCAVWCNQKCTIGFNEFWLT